MLQLGLEPSCKINEERIIVGKNKANHFKTAPEIKVEVRKEYRIEISNSIANPVAWAWEEIPIGSLKNLL